jgi:hypothetical protein
MRRDRWWLLPLGIASLLIAFVVYSTFAAFEGGYHWLNGTGYVSPFYSIEIFGNGPYAWFAGTPSWWPTSLIPYSSALLLLGIPAGFRFTCYYFRKAYYRSIWLDPVACAVGEPRSTYLGENSLPLILMNAHRYFLYLALASAIMLAYHGSHALFFPVNADGTPFQWVDVTGAVILPGGTNALTPVDMSIQPHHWQFGLGVGTLILLIDPLLILGYTFGCHSLRHLIGGRLDTFSGPCGNVRHQAWGISSWFNRHHNFWAMASLVWVAFADLYVRLCAHGVWTDWRIF